MTYHGTVLVCLWFVRFVWFDDHTIIIHPHYCHTITDKNLMQCWLLRRKMEDHWNPCHRLTQVLLLHPLNDSMGRRQHDKRIHK